MIYFADITWETLPSGELLCSLLFGWFILWVVVKAWEMGRGRK
ncbi:MAG: hypothetical protein WA817_12140 [Candidatus Acidiferrum sp.]